MAANPRRKSRIAALQALYESDVSGHETLASLARLCVEERPDRSADRVRA